ncbi:MAG: hypothetical protein ABIS50_10935 [Luteolibacter sp.]|uniref:hypothetical protein n=1 Tax=Luteolibacter sp. TaxID=1962973 RepID=UPI003264BFC8
MSGGDDPYTSPERQVDSDPANARSCLKALLIWISPSFAVPLLVAICGAAWPLGAILAIGFLIWMGRISAKDSSGSALVNIPLQTGRVVIYVVVQLVWIPLFWAAVVLGFCALK